MVLTQDVILIFTACRLTCQFVREDHYYFGIKLSNHLPLNIEELSYNAKQFRKALRAFLHSKSFYTLDEYFN
jgi:hypothetical protein